MSTTAREGTGLGTKGAMHSHGQFRDQKEMRSPKRAVVGVGAALMALLVSAGAVPATQAAARTGVAPIGLPVVAGEFSVTQVAHTGQWVGARGGWLKEATYLTLDRTTGSRTERAADWNYGAESGLVRDNPALFLEVTPSSIYVFAGAWLVNTTTGVRTRIDAGSDGVPLAPAWQGTCDEECGLVDYPGVQVAPESVSRDGRLVAFCANYTTRTAFDLYVKDTVSGQLTQRPGLCGAGGPAEMRHQYFQVEAPEISNDGRVVHVRGALDSEEGYFLGDSLLFTRTGSVRSVNGQGSMTRDGGLIFMRIGTYAPGTKDRTGGKVGAYNVRTKKAKTLPGRYRIYGTEALMAFSAHDLASMRGRYVAYGDRLKVIDRKTGKTRNIRALMIKHGFTPPAMSTWKPFLSGNGKVLVTISGSEYVAVTLL
jgi:hypothetical protein